jgi:ferric iron reductase protein FhuF
MTVECTGVLSTDREVMLLSLHSQYYLELMTVECTGFLSSNIESETTIT